MLSEPGCGICQRWEGISPLLWLVSGRENLPGQFRETSPSQNSRVSSFGMLLNSTYLLLLALWQSWVLRLSPFLPFVKVTRLWFQKLINSSSYFPVHWRSYQTVALSVFPTCWGQKVTLGTSRHHFLCSHFCSPSSIPGTGCNSHKSTTWHSASRSTSDRQCIFLSPGAADCWALMNQDQQHMLLVGTGTHSHIRNVYGLATVSLYADWGTHLPRSPQHSRRSQWCGDGLWQQYPCDLVRGSMSLWQCPNPAAILPLLLSGANGR